MRKKLLLVAIVAVLAGLGYYLSRALNRNPNRVIKISGNIEITEVKIAFKTAGKLIERTVDEGDVVKKGMVVARLDREQLISQRKAQRAALMVAESQLSQLETAVALQRQTVEGEIAARAAELQQADAVLRELLAGSRTQEIAEAKAAVDAAQTEATRAQSDWERAQALFKTEDISAAQFDMFRTQYERAVATLRQARERFALVREGPRKETIEAAEAQVARAKAALTLAQAGQLELKRRQQELGARRAEIERARAQIAIIDSQIRDAEVASPIDGIVLVKSAEVGETLGAGATVMTIGDLQHPWLRGYINEPDLGKVKLNARVKLTTDAFPGKVYWGRVSFIASEAEFTPKQIQTIEERVKLVYRIKVHIPNPRQELKSNMPVEAEILLD